MKRVDPAAGKAEDFFAAKTEALGPPGLEYVTAAAGRRPARADGALYVVDIGPVHFLTTAQGPAARPFPGTGTIWKVTRADGTK